MVSLDRVFKMSLSEVFEDLMDPDKDGDGTFAETFGNIKPLKS